MNYYFNNYKNQNMKTSIKFLGLFCLMILMSCSSAIKTKKHVNYDLNDYKTFAYLPNTSFDVDDFDAEGDRKVQQDLVDALNENMSVKGFTVDNKNPDLLVLMSTKSSIDGEKAANPNQESDATLGSGGGTGGNNYAAVSSSNYKRYVDNSTSTSRLSKTGSLLIEIFSTETKELVWSGSAENFTTHISDQTLGPRLLYEMLKDFPG